MNSKRDKTSSDPSSVIEGEESEIIIPKIFDYLSKTNMSSYQNIVMPILGTKKPQKPYNITFSLIINNFCRVCYVHPQENNNKNLILSVRKEDYEDEAHISLSQLTKYVIAASNFYK